MAYKVSIFKVSIISILPDDFILSDVEPFPFAFDVMHTFSKDESLFKALFQIMKQGK